MKFGAPEFLYLLALAPVMAVLFVLFNRQAERRLAKFANPKTAKRLLENFSARRRLFKFALFLSAVVFIVITLARPQFGVAPKEVKRVGVDIVIALDTSLSMAAEDIAPSRLVKAKKEVERLAGAFEGNRLGLLLFAGESAVECPLTLDISTFRLFLNAIGFNSIPVAGTDISGALRKAMAALEESSAKSRVIVLITDGEDNEGDPAEVAKEAEEKGIHIYTVGLGSEAGVPIPMRDESGKLRGYKKDSSGETVLTRQNGKSLKEIADLTDGLFVSSRNGMFDITPVIKSIKSLRKSEISSTRFVSYIDRFQWPLGVAILLIFAELLI